MGFRQRVRKAIEGRAGVRLGASVVVFVVGLLAASVLAVNSAVSATAKVQASGVHLTVSSVSVHLDTCARLEFDMNGFAEIDGQAYPMHAFVSGGADAVSGQVYLNVSYNFPLAGRTAAGFGGVSPGAATGSCGPGTGGTAFSISFATANAYFDDGSGSGRQPGTFSLSLRMDGVYSGNTAVSVSFNGDFTPSSPTPPTTTAAPPPPPPPPPPPTTTGPPPGDEVRPTISSTTLPVGFIGVPYRFVLSIHDGSPPYTVLMNGTAQMPPGLTLGADGVIEGTPTSEGSFYVYIKVADQLFPPSIGAASVFTLTLLITHPSLPTTTAAQSPFTPPTVKLILPRRSLTPGSVNPAVRQSTIKTTICAANWTKTIRPPASYTNALKLTQMKQYGETGKPTAYEEDQLIPLELGGAPRDPKNLWPEPRSQSKHSNPLETSLKQKVCHGSLTLASARAQILAYKRTKG